MAQFKNRWLPYLLLSPSIAIIAIFLVYPTLDTFRLSLYRSPPFGGSGIFIGLQNYRRLFLDASYISSIAISIAFTAFVVIVGLLLGLGIATLANQRLPGFAIYRSLLIFPYALSPAIAGILWAFFLDPNVGPIARLSRDLFGAVFNWRTDSLSAFLLIAFAATWKMLGYNAVFLLASMQGTPRELLEASTLDGADAWTRFWRIRFPLMTPIVFFLVIMNTLYAFFDIFGLLNVTTLGGPGRSTELLIYKLYRDGFESLRVGYASSQSILLFAIVAVITIIQFKVGQRRVFYQ